MRVGLLPLGRPTFDVPFAEATLAKMVRALEATGHELLGTTTLLLDAEAGRSALSALVEQSPDVLFVMQVTFTDAAFIVEAASTVAAPIAIWAPLEPRLGGRLRLNAFCGLNLASHALGRRGVSFSYLYAAPDSASIESELQRLLDGELTVVRQSGEKASSSTPLPAELRNFRIARIGEHPEGFDTCAYEPAALKGLLGAEVTEIDLPDFFTRAERVPKNEVSRLREMVSAQLDNLADMNGGEVDRSLRLANALQEIRQDGGYDAIAVRCWPEAFTEFGGAVCGPAAIMGESGLPCACEADVYGAVTQAILYKVTRDPVFLVDLVDLDADDDTGVVWHCGQAPISMADPSDKPKATVHSNRRMALLYEFPLKPGRVTFFRLSQAFGEPKIVVASGEMLARPKAFTGTSGAVRFDHAAEDVLHDVMDSGLEHHLALAYGDHIDALVSIAGALDLKVIHLGARHG